MKVCVMHSMEDGLEAWSLLRLLHITRQIVCMDAALLQSCRGEVRCLVLKRL